MLPFLPFFLYFFFCIITLDLCRASLKTTLCDVGSLLKDLTYYYYHDFIRVSLKNIVPSICWKVLWCSKMLLLWYVAEILLTKDWFLGHVHKYPEIFFSANIFLRIRKFRLYTQGIRIVFSCPHVSDCIRKFSDFALVPSSFAGENTEMSMRITVILASFLSPLIKLSHHALVLPGRVQNRLRWLFALFLTLWCPLFIDNNLKTSCRSLMYWLCKFITAALIWTHDIKLEIRATNKEATTLFIMPAVKTESKRMT